MEGSESGVAVPSVLEAETWVKLCNFPDKFLTADDITLIVSSFGSVVGTDEDTYEKMENHLRPPNLRRKLHSHITFVTIFVRVSVTEPLPSRVAVGSKNGREFIIRLDFDPTPKVCLLCHGAGHFDFECCGTGKDSEEIIAEAGVGFEEVNVVAGEDVGAATSKVSLGDPPVLEADPPLTVKDVLEVSPLCLPPVSCAFEAAKMGELEAMQTLLVVNRFNKHHKWRDKSEVQGLFCLLFEDLVMSQTLPSLVWILVASNHDQLFFKIHHKWRDKELLI